MENNTIRKKSIAISFAAIFLLNIILTGLGNGVIWALLAGFYENTSDTYIGSSYNSALMSVGNFVVNIITIASIIIAGKKLTGNKIGTIRFLGCYYFGAAVGTLFSSLVSNVLQYLMIRIISSSTVSTIINISSVLSLVPAILAAYMAFTAFEGINDKIPVHPVNVSLSKARSIFIITFIISAVVGGYAESLPSLVMALTNPEPGSFVSETLIFAGYFVKWLINVITFSIVYIAGYRTTKSHYGAINFYLPATAFSVPVIGIIGGISSIIVSFLRYSEQLKIAEVVNDDLKLEMMSGNSIVMTVIAIAGTVISSVVGFIISYKALSLFYKKKTESAPVEQ